MVLLCFPFVERWLDCVLFILWHRINVPQTKLYIQIVYIDLDGAYIMQRNCYYYYYWSVGG